MISHSYSTDLQNKENGETPMIPISLCMITKNESDKLDRCLAAVKDLPLEIIVVDTGSTDNSIEVARKYTEHVYHFDWISDFAAARNFSVSKATNDWILVLDTDEYVTSVDMEAIYKLIDENATGVGCLIRTSPDTVGSITVDHVERLFNKKFYMYKRPIHEQVLPIDETLTAFCSFDIPLYVDHDGYFSSKEEMDLKAKRNLDILLASEHDYPDSYTYFQIGQSYYIMGDYENACRYFEKGLNFDLSPESEFVQLMIVHYGYSLLNMDRGEDAQLFLEQVYSYFDFLADFLMVIGTVYIRNEHYMKAALQFIKATQTEKFFTLGTNSFRAYYHLGAVYEMIGQPENALLFYEKCGAYDLAQERIKFLKESQK
jgi:predicted glycosyltransferase